ncbi:MAG: 4-(cytidine 5'-diphospho)-2-C-methyl-D-erythritol kinase [Chloroflexota bacterium]|nr:4-(cytidine 5'-diphospho)-2-C-methyl-D-erythritol kinase [Chloroflexota bacterium]
MAGLTLRAYAKINLGLEVIQRREDGYHELVTILQTVSLYDEIVVGAAEALTLHCDRSWMDGRRNLMWKAADLLQKESGTQMGAAMNLVKTIPISAGLGGGSSDAAAALRCLNDLWGLNINNTRLAELASHLGSDVPFFLQGGTQMATGRGELLEPLCTPKGQWLVLVSPDIRVPRKTPLLYENLGPRDFSDGSMTTKLAETLRVGGAIPTDCIVNAFERAAHETFPGLHRHRKAMLEAGAEQVHLSGSGPSLFTLMESKCEGDAFQKRLGELGFYGIVVQTVAAEGLN